MSDLFGNLPSAPVDLNGATLWLGLLDPDAQREMIAALRDVAKTAPFRNYQTPGGKPMSVRMTAAGNVGWVADRTGYRYSDTRPDGGAWPAIPESVLSVWNLVAGVDRRPDSCLVNFYGEGARMGLHQDRDEGELGWPVVSISLGDEGLFRIGGTSRRGPTQSRWLTSGDVVVLSGDARLAYHGVDRIKFRSSDLLPDGGRINVTLRVAG